MIACQKIVVMYIVKTRVNGVAGENRNTEGLQWHRLLLLTNISRKSAQWRQYRISTRKWNVTFILTTFVKRWFKMAIRSSTKQSSQHPSRQSRDGKEVWTRFKWNKIDFISFINSTGENVRVSTCVQKCNLVAHRMRWMLWNLVASGWCQQTVLVSTK